MGYLHNRGDYGSYRGDPGILGSIGRVLGGVVGNLVPGGSIVSSAVRAVSGMVSRGNPRSMPAAPGGMQLPVFGNRGAPAKQVTVNKQGMVVAKRRRMNVTNAKALRRAIRRTDGFVKLAKKALKGTGYTVARRGAGRKAPRTIVETGPGSVHTR